MASGKFNEVIDFNYMTLSLVSSFRTATGELAVFYIFYSACEIVPNVVSCG